jgi:hypothetical protein
MGGRGRVGEPWRWLSMDKPVGRTLGKSGVHQVREVMSAGFVLASRRSHASKKIL